MTNTEESATKLPLVTGIFQLASTCHTLMAIHMYALIFSLVSFTLFFFHPCFLSSSVVPLSPLSFLALFSLLCLFFSFSTSFSGFFPLSLLLLCPYLSLSLILWLLPPCLHSSSASPSPSLSSYSFLHFFSKIKNAVEQRATTDG